jgi:hypothetical protein
MAVTRHARRAIGSRPGMLGPPSFIVGAVALGLVDIGVLPNAPNTAALPILLAAASIGLFLATVWSAFTGQNAAAGSYGIFGGGQPGHVLQQQVTGLGDEDDEAGCVAILRPPRMPGRYAASSTGR